MVASALAAGAAPPSRAGPAPRAEVVACRECGQVHRLPPMDDHHKAECVRCNATLCVRVHRTVDRALACHVAALILFGVANAYPILTLSLEGRAQATTIVGGADALWRTGMPLLATLVLLLGTLVPLAKILGNLYVLLPLRLGARPPALAQAFRLIELLRPWAMMEVYLLGLIVAFVKLGDLASVEPGVAAVAFVALILVATLGEISLDPHEVWNRVAPQAGPEVLRPAAGTVLLACHTCDQLSQVPGAAEADAECPRCGAALHRRKPESVARTWALLLAAAILYVPANTLPIMTVVHLGNGVPSTILGGIATLLEEGMVPVALLVLFASIVVPVLKLVGLAWLLLSVQLRSIRRPRDRTLLYRIVEGVGRWSMVDVFMVAILTALVRLGNLASVEPGMGALAFAAVVVITMLAAASFDPRLIWDVVDERSGHTAAPAPQA